MNGNGTAPTGAGAEISMDKVVAIMQREFPTEFRICLQAAYIEQLEAKIADQVESASDRDTTLRQS